MIAPCLSTSSMVCEVQVESVIMVDMTGVWRVKWPAEACEIEPYDECVSSAFTINTFEGFNLLAFWLV